MSNLFRKHLNQFCRDCACLVRSPAHVFVLCIANTPCVPELYYMTHRHLEFPYHALHVQRTAIKRSISYYIAPQQKNECFVAPLVQCVRSIQLFSTK